MRVWTPLTTVARPMRRSEVVIFYMLPYSYDLFIMPRLYRQKKKIHEQKQLEPHGIHCLLSLPKDTRILYCVLCSLPSLLQIYWELIIIINPHHYYQVAVTVIQCHCVGCDDMSQEPEM